MTPEEQQIAIAEACGWTKIGWNGVYQNWLGVSPSEERDKHPIPDYLNDLNAMHEAEGRHDFDMHNNRYGRILAEVVTGQPQGSHHITANWWTIKRIARATAAQRAEAFLKTLNLWKP